MRRASRLPSAATAVPAVRPAGERAPVVVAGLVARAALLGGGGRDEHEYEGEREQDERSVTAWFLLGS